NIRVALTWALASEPDLALRLVGRMRLYWRIRRAAVEGLGAIDAALRAVGPGAAIGDRAEAELCRSDLLFHLGDTVGAQAASRRARELYLQSGDPVGITEAWCGVAADAIVAGDVERGRSEAEEAYRRALALGHGALMAKALGFLAATLP